VEYPSIPRTLRLIMWAAYWINVVSVIATIFLSRSRLNVPPEQTYSFLAIAVVFLAALGRALQRITGRCVVLTRDAVKFDGERIPYGDIEDVRVVEAGAVSVVEIRTTDGRVHRLRVADPDRFLRDLVGLLRFKGP